VVGNGNGAEVKQRVGSLEEENKTLREELAKLNTKVEGMSTEKQAVLADLRGLNTDQLKALMSMADQFNQKKRKEPMVKVNVTEETEKGVRQNE
jgi:regulator of replication initiation timing